MIGLDCYHKGLLHGSVSQGLGTTKFTNLTGWNGYWPRSRFSHFPIYFFKCQKGDEKKSKEDEQTLEKMINWAHRRSQAKCELVETSYIARIKLFLFLLYNKHLINRPESVCILTSVVCTHLTAIGLYLRPSVKILPYRHPIRLKKAKSGSWLNIWPFRSRIYAFLNGHIFA